MNDSDAIKAALTELGYVYEEHSTAQNLYGYEGNKRSQKANIIIRRQNVGSCANDVGFLRKADGSYEMIISEFDKSGNKKQAQDLLVRMKQLYGKHLTLKHVKRFGLKTISNKITSDNKIKIKLTI